MILFSHQVLWVPNARGCLGLAGWETWWGARAASSRRGSPCWTGLGGLPVWHWHPLHSSDFSLQIAWKQLLIKILFLFPISWYFLNNFQHLNQWSTVFFGHLTNLMWSYFVWSSYYLSKPLIRWFDNGFNLFGKLSIIQMLNRGHCEHLLW